MTISKSLNLNLKNNEHSKELLFKEEAKKILTDHLTGQSR